MKLVKNIPADSTAISKYKGVEPTPLGRGYSAKFDPVGKKRVGLDKNLYISVKRGNSNIWRLVEIRKQKGGTNDSDMMQLILNLELKSQSKSVDFVENLKKAAIRYKNQLRDKKLLQEAVDKVVVKIQDEQVNSASVVFESDKPLLSEFFSQYMGLMQNYKTQGIPNEIVEDIKAKPTVVQIHLNTKESYGPGVARQLLKSCLDEAFKVFFKQPPDSDRYFLNQDLTNLQISDIVKIQIDNERRSHVFIILGLLFVLCIKYGITTEHTLSRGILSQILLDDSNIENDDTYDNILYYLLDYKDTTLLNMLKEDLDNSNIWKNINVSNILPHPDHDIIDNSIKYHDWLANLAMTRLYYPNEHTNENDLVFFTSCFELLINTYQLSKELDIVTLDNLISRDPFTIENLQKLQYVVNKGVLDEKQHEKIQSWINELLDPSKVLSNKALKRVLTNNVQKINNSNNSNNSNISQEYKDFIQNLLVFWSGSDKIYENRIYEITSITANGQKAYPTASTCFFQLKLPHNIQSQEDLYNRLYIASQEKTFAFTGGKSKHKTLRKRKSKR